MLTIWNAAAIPPTRAKRWRSLFVSSLSSEEHGDGRAEQSPRPVGSGGRSTQRRAEGRDDGAAHRYGYERPGEARAKEHRSQGSKREQLDRDDDRHDERGGVLGDQEGQRVEGGPEAERSAVLTPLTCGLPSAQCGLRGRVIPNSTRARRAQPTLHRQRRFAWSTRAFSSW
jgi:hypothetical protein